MPELEQELIALAQALDWPATPEIHLPALRGGRAPLAAPGWGVATSTSPPRGEVAGEAGGWGVAA
jgi:hypothetical protein